MRGATKRQRMSRGMLLAGPVVTMLCVPALAGPEGEKVVSGRAKFKRDGNRTVIRASDGAIINYSSFDIGANERVRFIQPGESARVLNRVLSADPTTIAGTLTANGRVYITNPAGIHVVDGAVVNVGQLYAAAGNISDADFARGRDAFTLEGSVINEGRIVGRDGVALMGRSVENLGRIASRDGMVAMVAGDAVIMGERGGHMHVRIDSSVAEPVAPAEALGSVENAGGIRAANGRVYVGAGDAYGLVLHHNSQIKSPDVMVQAGRGATAEVSGRIDASDRSGVGGRVQITGEKVALRGAQVDAWGRDGGGEVLVGGDFQGGGDLPSARRTLVDDQSHIDASARRNGDGGKVIVWADESTGYAGRISARGGREGGAGGFVEVSGKQSLIFLGDADLASRDGRHGTLLLDPDNITIEDGNSSPHDGDPDFLDGMILAGEGPADTFISEGFLEGFGDMSLVLQANDNITIEDLSDNVLSLAATGGRSIAFVADFDGDGTGAITMLGADDVVRTQGGDLDFSGAILALAGLDTSGGGGSGAITLTATDALRVGAMTTGGGNVLLTAPQVRLENTGATATAAGDFVVDGDLILVEDTQIETNGGLIRIDGNIDGDGNGPWELSLLARAGSSGNAEVTGVVGASDPLAMLLIEAWDALLGGIGDETSPGVLGETTVIALDDIQFVGPLYHTSTVTYVSGDENRIVGDTTFRSQGESVAFVRRSEGTVGDDDGFQGVLLREGASLTVETAGGDITVQGGVQRTAGAGDAAISFDAGAGSINVDDAIGGDAVFGSLDVGRVEMAAETITLHGVRSEDLQDFQATTISLDGDHIASAEGAGSITFGGNVLLEGDTLVQGGGGVDDDVLFAGTINGGFELDVRAGSGDVRINGAIGDAEPPLERLDVRGADIRLPSIGGGESTGVSGAARIEASNDLILLGNAYQAGSLTLIADGATRLTGDAAFTTTGGNIRFDGVGGLLQLESGARASMFSDGGNITIDVPVAGDTGDEALVAMAGAGTLTLRSVGLNPDGTTPTQPTVRTIELSGNEVDLLGRLMGRELVIEPGTIDRDVAVGVGQQGGRLNLTADEVNLIQEGFDSIIIGREDGTGDIILGGGTWNDPVTFRQDPDGEGTIEVQGDLTGLGNASFTFIGGAGTTLSGGISTEGGAVHIEDDLLLTTDTVVATEGGDITVDGDINGGFALELLAGDADDSGTEIDRGLVTIHGDIGLIEALTGLTIVGFDVAMGAIGSEATPGVTGDVSVNAGDDIIFRGETYHAGSLRFQALDENRIEADAALFLTDGGAIRFPNGRIILQDGADLTIRSNGGAISVTGGISTSEDPELEADIVIDAGGENVTIGGPIGRTITQAPATVTITGATISLDRVTTTQGQTYNGDVTLNDDLTIHEMGSIEISGRITLLDDVLLSIEGAEGERIFIGGGATDAGDDFNLSLNAGEQGAVVVQGPIGEVDDDDPDGGDALGDFHIIRAGDVTLGQVFAESIDILAGNMTFDGLLRSDGGGISILGNNLAFNGPIQAGAGGVDITGTEITFAGDVFTDRGGDFSVSNAGRLFVPEDVEFNIGGDFTQSGAGRVEWAGELLRARQSTITFTSRLELANDLTLRGRSIRLEGLVDSDATPRTLTLRGGGRIEISGGLGTRRRLAELHVLGAGPGHNTVISGDVRTRGVQNYDGRTTLEEGADLRSRGPVRFGGRTAVNGDASITSQDEVSFADRLTLAALADIVAGSDVVFGGDVRGASDGEGRLRVLIDQEIPDLNGLSDAEIGAIAESMGVVRFLGSLGAEEALERVVINRPRGRQSRLDSDGGFAGSEFPPAATIVFGEGRGSTGDDLQNFEIHAETFRVGIGEKMTVLGNLDMQVDEAHLGDVNVLGTASISPLEADTAQIRLLARPRGVTLIEDDGIFVALPDTGGDFVIAGIEGAGDRDRRSSSALTATDVEVEIFTPEGVDDGSYVFVLPGGLAAVGGNSQDEIGRALVLDPTQQFAREQFTTAGGVALDLDGRVAGGTTAANVATARANAIAGAEQVVDVPEETTIGEDAFGVLAELGLALREPDADVLLQAMIGRALYNDLGTPGGELTISRQRLDFDLVSRVVRSYREVFDPDGDGSTAGGKEMIGDMVTRAADDYQQATGRDPEDNIASFGRFIAGSSRHQELADAMVGLRRLLADLELLGLTAREMQQVENNLFSAEIRGPLSREAFEQLVRQTPPPGTVPAAPDDTGPTDLDPIDVQPEAPAADGG